MALLSKVYCGTMVVSDGKTMVLNGYYYYNYIFMVLQGNCTMLTKTRTLVNVKKVLWYVSVSKV